MKNESSRPNFICIGLQKAGTTWIWMNLKKHPDVYLTPVKEVKFLWGYGKKHQEERSFIGNFLSRIFGSTSINFRKHYFKRRIRNHRNKTEVLTTKDVLWDLKFLLGPQSVKWYSSLFDPNKISGDLDPRYARFTSDEIEKIKHHLPEVKIFLVLRNPIDRVWSSMKMRYKMYEKQSLEKSSKEEILATIDVLLSKHMDYSSIIKSWNKEFTGEQFKVFYMDELGENTLGYFRKVCDFIGVDYQRMGEERLDNLRKKVFEGQQKKMPAFIKEYIAEKTFDSIKRLQKDYPSKYVDQWIEEYTTILNQKALTNAK